MLGPVQAYVNGRAVDLGHAKQRCVLPALLVEANRAVPVDQLVERTWGERIPQRARNTLSGYLSRLRRALHGVPDVAIERTPSGYLITIDPMAVDLHRFRRLAGQARAAGDDTLLTAALGLWRGEAFGALDTPWINSVRAGLHAERLAAAIDRNELAFDRGRHFEVLPELVALAGQYPLDEHLAAQLMLAFYRCGRQAQALEAFQRIRRALADDLGTDPGELLRTLHQRILTADPDLDSSQVRPVAQAASRSPAPQQLPAPPRTFAGRVQALAELDKVAAMSGDSAIVVTISGTAGVGKTALAVFWAHKVSHRFPDGQLYLNLRGFDPSGSPVGVAEALRALLDAVAVPPSRIPASLDAQSSLYRSQLAGRRMLIVLDNAHGAAQVRPLLAGSPGCLVLVTSRDQLTGLVAADDAYPLSLGLLDRSEAGELLAKRLGSDRVSAEPQAVDEIISRCAFLPLALAVIASRGATHPRFRLAQLAAELSAAGGDLQPFTGSDPAVDARVVFSCSYQPLTTTAARLFRLLSVYPGPDIGIAAAVSLAGRPAHEVRQALAELAGAHLITESAPGRFAMHDLLRAYAAELAEPQEHHHARHRIFDHYVHSAHSAAMKLDPRRDPISLAPALAEVVADDPVSALEWFTTEYPCLLEAVQQAARTGFDAQTWALAWSLTDFFNRRGHWHDQATCYTAAVQAACQLADEGRQGYAQRILARALARLQRYDEALELLRQARDRFSRLGDGIGLAHTHLIFSFVYERLERRQAALDHDYEALRLFRAAGHLVGQARALNNVGWRLADLGEHERALVYCEQALQLCRQIGDRYDEANAADSLGFAHQRLGRYGEAATYYSLAVRLCREVGHRDGEADGLAHLGDIHHLTGDSETARLNWQKALAIYDDLGHPRAQDLHDRLRDPGKAIPETP